MKRSLRALVPTGTSLALLAFAGTAQAQSDRGFYVGAGVGSTTFKTTQVTASLPPQTLTIKDSSSSVRVFGGYRASRFIFFEAGAVAFGEIKERTGSTVSELQTYRASYGGWDVSVIGNLPLADGAFDLFGRLGVARTVYDSLIFDNTDPGFGVESGEAETQRTALYGLGGQFNFGPDRNMGLRIEYNIYDVNLLAEDQTSVMASFVYRF